PRRVAEGCVDCVFRDRRMSVDLNYDLDLAQTLRVARGLLPRVQRSVIDVLDLVTSAAGRAQGRLGMQLTPGAWLSQVAVVRSDSVLHLRDVLWSVQMRSGRVT